MLYVESFNTSSFVKYIWIRYDRLKSPLHVTRTKLPSPFSRTSPRISRTVYLSDNRVLSSLCVSGMTAKQVEEELDSMRKEVLQFKQEFRRERDKLDRLSKEYEDSKKLSPPQRYTELKYMIKDAVNTK